MTTRRGFLKQSGIMGGVLGSGLAAAVPSSARSAPKGALAERLSGEIAQMAVDDSHCHPISSHDAQTTPDYFLERLALSAFPAPNYFPEGVFERWRSGDAATKQALDAQYGIAKTLNSILRHFESSVFVKYMLKEMAGFLDCKPRLDEVIEARNARGADYYGYIGSLFRDARIENAMVDTGFRDGLDAAGMDRFAAAIQPARTRYLARVERLTNGLLDKDIPYSELRDAYVQRVRDALDGTGNFGHRSYGMKSYLLPDIGLLSPVYDDEAAAASWESFKKTRKNVYTDRSEKARRGKVLRERLLTISVEECMARDMPMQFHAGDGEAPSVILRNQHPYYLEELALRQGWSDAHAQDHPDPCRLSAGRRGGLVEPSVYQCVFRNLVDDALYPPGPAGPLSADHGSGAVVEDPVRQRCLQRARAVLAGGTLGQAIPGPGAGGLRTGRRTG